MLSLSDSAEKVQTLDHSTDEEHGPKCPMGITSALHNDAPGPCLEDTARRGGQASDDTMDEESYHYVEGVWMHSFFQDDTIRSAVNYKHRDGDIFVVTYPKCGTHWMQFIVYNILTRAEPVSSLFEFRLKSPFMDLFGAAAVHNPLKNGPITTHLPFKALRLADCAKYIYVARNPYDCAVSYYNFIKGITPKTVTDVSFEKFLSLYHKGKVIYGDYFDHLLPWYESREADNIHLVTYERLKTDTSKEVLKIAEFLGKEHANALRHDKALLESVLNACSLEKMKVLFNDKPSERSKKLFEAALEKPEAVVTPTPAAEEEVQMHEGSAFVRKGIVGDWRNYFTTEQIKRTKEWIAGKTQGSDVMNLWANCDLP
ncbi:hypothetical protein HPB51_026405 [Rhipicephalus microplus]|uniref:Sulfotransferase domain-containing protein n=1 Tax=Rhipicephalus microplus TaxID=6941 RepID=A0A9J6D361_RHIMP|nr:hypothetical protein HPB51_026405 [Rhipicephalus microplus]